MNLDPNIKSPIVSVVMPVYNGARTLPESIGSVLRQTFRRFELVICNDASTDDTGTILKNITDNRVRVLQNESNLGEGATRDRAIASSRGIWLAVIDADDAWASERLATLLKVAEESNETMIFDNIYECHDTAYGIVPWRILREDNAFDSNGSAVISVPVERFVCQQRLLIKPLLPLQAINRNNVRHSNRSFGADTEYFLQLMAHGLKLCYVPKPMYYYRITPGSMSGLTNRSTLMREVLENAFRNFDHAPAVQAALRQKIGMVTNDERYMPFLKALRQKRFYRAAQIVHHRPWIIVEFFRRLNQSLAYHLHRIRHHGRIRGIR